MMHIIIIIVISGRMRNGERNRKKHNVLKGNGHAAEQTYINMYANDALQRYNNLLVHNLCGDVFMN